MAPFGRHWPKILIQEGFTTCSLCQNGVYSDSIDKTHYIKNKIAEVKHDQSGPH